MMQQIDELIKHIYINGVNHNDRTNEGRISVYGHQMRFNLQEGFPIYNRKFTSLKEIVCENIWFLNGCTDTKSLNILGSKIWDKWGLKEDVLVNTYKPHHVIFNDFVVMMIKDKGMVNDIGNTARAQCYQILRDNTDGSINDGVRYMKEQGVIDKITEVKLPAGTLGPVYGAQWREWKQSTPNTQPIDQIKWLVENLVRHPYSSRHYVTSWNPEFVPDEALSHDDNIRNGKAVIPACHASFQCFVVPLNATKKLQYPDNLCYTEGKPDNVLTMHLYMRSSDVLIGLPYNVAGYSLLLHLLAKKCGYGVGELIVSFGDAHIYANQLDLVPKLFKNNEHPLPHFKLADEIDIFDNLDKDLIVNSLTGYEHSGVFKLPVAV